MAEESLVWPYAFDDNNQMVVPSHAVSGQTYYYDFGSNRVSLCFKKCVKRTPHFAMHADHNGTRPFFRGMSSWHIYWQTFAQKEYREVTSKNRRADVKTPDGLVIEIQKSPISSVTVEQRNEDHKQNIIWILDATHPDLVVECQSLNPLKRQVLLSNLNLSRIAGGGPFRAAHCKLFLDFGCSDFIFDVQNVDYANDSVKGCLMKTVDFLQLNYNQSLVSREETIKLLNLRPYTSKRFIQKIETHREKIVTHLESCYRTNIFDISPQQIDGFRQTIYRGEKLMEHMKLNETEPGSVFYTGLQDQTELSARLQRYDEYLSFSQKWSSMKHEINVLNKNISSCPTDALLDIKQKKRKEMFEIQQKYKYPSFVRQEPSNDQLSHDDYSGGNYESMETLKHKHSSLVLIESQMGIQDYDQLETSMDRFVKTARINCLKCHVFISPHLNDTDICEMCVFQAVFQEFSCKWSIVKGKVETSKANLEKNGHGPILEETQRKMKSIFKMKKEDDNRKWPNSGFEVSVLLSDADFKAGNYEPLECLQVQLSALVARETELGIHNFDRLQKETDLFVKKTNRCSKCHAIKELYQMHTCFKFQEPKDPEIQEKKDRDSFFFTRPIEVSGSYIMPFPLPKLKRKRK